MKFFRSLYLRNRVFYLAGGLIFLFVMGSYFSLFYVLARLSAIILGASIVVEAVLLYRQKKGIEGYRDTPENLSNGDDNNIYIHLRNNYPFKTYLEIIDEIPVQFQVRENSFFSTIPGGESGTILYTLRPTERGEFHFGKVNVYASTILRLIQRRYSLQQEKMLPVYPSYLQFKKYKFLAFSDNLREYGIKPVRKLGHNYEFDQIREYIEGDDYRSINWKATAKSNRMMVNQYQDEKSQHIYAVINMGRVMEMPFNNLTLLDYSINSALVMLNTAFVKDDKPGLITFNKSVKTVLKASRNRGQMKKVMETLYNQRTDFSEAEYETLYFNLTRIIRQRSMLFLFTNFESIVSLRREIGALKSIAKKHLLIVILFRNTELDELEKSPAKNVRQVYTKTIAKKFRNEKELIVRELKKNGIDSILTRPESLTVDAINKYLEMKARRRI